MNGPTNQGGKSKLEGLLRSQPAPGASQPSKPIELLEPEGDTIETEAADRCGRSSARGHFNGFVIEMDNGNREGFFYGSIAGRVRYNPSLGVTFIAEDAEGFWKVTIRGHNLFELHRELVLARRESIRLGTNVTDIEIVAWNPPKK